MAFRLVDVKKTVRSRSDGERYLHPRLLEGEAACTQVALLLGYFQARLGRARREFDPEVLVRFLGDPKVARGLVACLSAVYRWRSQAFAEVLDQRGLGRLAARGLHTPGDLRLFLYDALNRRGPGFLGPDREALLHSLAGQLHLSPAKLEQLVALDAEEHAVLVRVGPVPEPREVLALYNYHTVDALLRNSEVVELSNLDRAACQALQDACRDHAVDYEQVGRGVQLRNRPDAFGSFARGGLRLTRALYSAAAAMPKLLAAGRASVALPGKRAWYLLDRHSLQALTAGTGRILRAPTWPELRESWARRRAVASAEGAAGWRLIGMPDPILTPAGLVLAPFACRRGEAQVLLWPAPTPAAFADLMTLRSTGQDVLGLLPDGPVEDSSPELPCAPQSAGAAGVLAALGEGWGAGRVPAGLQVLESLLAEVATRGFLPERELLEPLGCAAPDELGPRLAGLDPARGTYVAGVGLCSPVFAAAMRKGLARRRRRTPAA